MATKPKQKHSLISPTAVPLLTRTVVFLGVFVLMSGLIGPRIISGGIQNSDGFGLYGGLGKACIFAALAFMLLAYRRGLDVQLKPWQPYNLVWLVLAALSFIGAWIGVSHLLHNPHAGLAAIIATHAALLASLVLAAGGIFGSANLRQLLRHYRREVLLSVGLGAAFYVFLTLVYGLWTVLSAIVLHSAQWLLGLIGLHSTFVPPRTLLFDKFGIDIAEYCSGIESIALFTGLYALIGILDWRRFNQRKFLYVFLPALILLFVFNILRVTVLIAAGYYINPQIAFSLFHTYAGMIFFIVYSIIFWDVSYRWMLKDRTT